MSLKNVEIVEALQPTGVDLVAATREAERRSPPTDAGDRVVVFARISGRTMRDGVEVEHKSAAVYTLSEGLVRRVEFYLDRAEALRSAGLQE